MALRPRIVRLLNWQALSARLTPKNLPGEWYFRGGLASWGLETSLERAFLDWRLPLRRMVETERRLLREVKRTLGTTAAAPPDKDDTLGWLALMQHHGAPTRLSDWTYSAFVAVYFAMEALLSSRDSQEAAVWALAKAPFDRPARLVRSRSLLRAMEHFRRLRDGASFERVFFRVRNPLRFIYPVNPARLNQRLIIQQGLFLCPTDLSVSFEDNLAATARSFGNLPYFKFIIDRSLLQEAMAALHRMNMNQATLFPGLDGYARHFKARLEFICNGNLFTETRV